MTNYDRFKYPSVSDVYSHYCKPSYAGMSLEEIIKLEEKHSYIRSHCVAVAMDMWTTDTNDEYKLYIESFRKWQQENIKEVIATQILLFDDVNRFTGRIDIICTLKNDELVAITIKTSKKSKSWELQLSAYKNLCYTNRYDVKRNIILQLSKKGEIATEFECDDIDKSWSIFNNILNGWHYFKS